MKGKEPAPVENLPNTTGGVYIPPSKRMQGAGGGGGGSSAGRGGGRSGQYTTSITFVFTMTDCLLVLQARKHLVRLI